MTARLPTLPALVLLLTSLALPALARADDVGHFVARPAPWTGATLASFARVPIQDGGRVKPLSTYAGFTLLRLNGRRSLTTLAGERQGPTAWLLDCLFFPAQAARERVFLIGDRAVLDAVGLESAHRRKRDRYSYEDLRPARREIAVRATEYAQLEASARTSVQEQVVRLEANLVTLEGLGQVLAFARHAYDLPRLDAVRSLAPGAAQLRHAAILRLAPGLRRLEDDWAARAPRGRERAALRPLFGTLARTTAASRGLAFIAPPLDSQRTAWLTAADVTRLAFIDPQSVTERVTLLESLEHLHDARLDATAFEAAAGEFEALATALAADQPGASTVALEVAFYRLDPFTWALGLFLLAFLASAASWLRPQSRAARGAATLGALAGVSLLVAGIVLRCVIRGRPPVSTLYETILFIAAVGVLAGLAAAWLARLRVATGVSALFGALGMFLAYRYEAHEAVDTMPSLVAVLDTNFWLATHVTTITIGYAGGLLASAIAHVYVIGHAFGFRRDDRKLYAGLARAVYGTICFSLLFSVVGTILGGVWANESWGRFWGWDPKENGALMICLWQLAILHSRLGGHLRAFGISIAAIVGGLVVALSWWGVNLLGIGLHSYGFTSGAMVGLLAFGSFEALVIAVAGAGWFLRRRARVRG